MIKEEGINVVHTHNEAGLIYGAAAAILAKVPNIVHTEHGKEPNYYNKRILQLAEDFAKGKTCGCCFSGFEEQNGKFN